MSTTTTSSLTAVATGNITGAVLWGDDSAGTTTKFAVSKAATADTIVARDSSGGITVVSGSFSGSVLPNGGSVNFSNFVGTAKILGGSTGTTIRNTADSADNILITDAGVVTIRSTLITVLSATGAAGFRLPHGAAPTSPTNGDVWTTTAGAFCRINGVTKTFTLT